MRGVPAACACAPQALPPLQGDVMNRIPELQPSIWQVSSQFTSASLPSCIPPAGPLVFVLLALCYTSVWCSTVASCSRIPKSLVFPGYFFISWFIACLSLLPLLHLDWPAGCWPWSWPPLSNIHIYSFSLSLSCP